MQSRDPGTEPGHDLVADGVGGVGPLLRGRLARRAAEEGDDVTGPRGGARSEVDDELVHADTTGDRRAEVADADRADVRRIARDAVAVARRHEADDGVDRRGVHVAVADALAGRETLDEREPGPQG